MMLPFRKFSIFILAAVIVSPLLAAAMPPADQLLAAGRVDQAIQSLQERITTSPNDAESYNLLCRAQLALSNSDQGITACQKAVALDPKNSPYHLWLGRIYGQKAEHSKFFAAAVLAKKVRKEFETAVELDPHNLEARADLAEFYLEAPGIVGGGKDKAEIQAREMASLNPSQGHLVRAQIAEKKKDMAGAEKEYNAAIQSSGGLAGTWLSLAQFYYRRGNLDQMQNALQHAASGPGNQRVLMRAAEVLVHSKRELTTAIELLRRYLAGGTVEDDPAFKAHYLLGTLLEQRGDRSAAAAQYRAALSLAANFSPAQDALRRVSHQATDDRAAVLSGTE